MKFSITFKYSNVTFKNKETKETVIYDSKAEGNTFTFDNVDEDVVLGIVKGIKDRKASQVFAYDNFRTNFVNVIARNKCKELYDKLDKGGWKVEDIAISNITIKDLEFTKPTMNAREVITVESKNKARMNEDFKDTMRKENQKDLSDLIEVVSKAIKEIDIISNMYDVSDTSFEKLQGVRTMLLNALPSTKTAKKMGWCNESKEQVKVEFKKTPEDGEVIAFFPDTMKDGSCNPGMIMSYMHVGQHGEASVEFYNDCTNCFEEDYADLLAELEKVYDDCELVVVE